MDTLYCTGIPEKDPRLPNESNRIESRSIESIERHRPIFCGRHRGPSLYLNKDLSYLRPLIFVILKRPKMKFVT
jgi:hypothetical protein